MLSLAALPENRLAVNPSTIQDCFEGTPTLATVKKYQGQEVAIDTLADYMAQTSLLLNVGSNMRPDQMRAAAEMLLQDRYWLTLADYKLLLRMGVTGQFGKIYERLDVGVIYEWVSLYEERRAEVAEREQLRKHGALNDRRAEVGEMPDWFKDFLRDFAKKTMEYQAAKPTVYVSLRHYCDENEIDFDLKMDEWKSEWQTEYRDRKITEYDEETWMKYRYQTTLAQINKP